ncbi:MAG: hypothetical protein ACRC1P_01560 [Cellulosilyticaceae bacterium]
MPFLLNAKNSFIIVDNKPRQGLFYQLFNSTGFSRPLQIQPALSNCYTATLDSNDSLHVVAQNNRNQIVHYTYIDSHAHSTLLLDDNKDIYKFSNLILHSLGDSLHLFYTALRPNTNTYSLLHQQIDHGPSPIDHLLASFNPLTPVKSLYQNGIIYLLFITAQSDAYSLNCLSYSSSGVYSSVLLSSEFPIIDFDICLIDNVYHITYIQDTYGNYQLLYFNSQVARSTQLYTSNQLGSPCIFKYLGFLWINYLDNDSLYTLLSTNIGVSFSSPVKASLQNNLAKYIYYTTSPSSLEATHMYATVFNKVRLAIVSSIDTDGIHPDILPNTELDLLLAGLSFSSQFQSSYSQPSQPISSPTHSSSTVSPAEQRASTTYIAKPINMPTSQTASKPNSVLSAAQAFMNEVNMFDAQPIYLSEEK